MKKSELRQLIKQCIMQVNQEQIQQVSQLSTYKKIVVTLQNYNNNNKHYLCVTSKPFVCLGSSPNQGGLGLTNVFLDTTSTRGNYNYMQLENLISKQLVKLAKSCN